MTTAFDLGAMLSFGNNVQVRMIDCDLLVEYHNHKFSLYTGERLEDMVESIKANGIFTPLIVQPLGTKYEILIGHNRWNAGKLAGLTEVPCIVKTGLTEEEAEIYVIESNIMQRGFENLKISEQAEVLRIRYDSMFSQGKRNDIQRELIMLENGENPTSVPMETKLEKGKTSKDKVGEEYGISASSVARLLRITKLCDTIKEWVDNGEIAVRAAVNLSYLNLDEQELITYEDPKKLNMKVTSQLKDYAGVLDEETIDDIIRGKKENEEKPKPVKIQHDVYSRFFPDHTKPEEIQATIIKALETYFEQQKG